MILQLLLLLSLLPWKLSSAKCPWTVPMDEIEPFNYFRQGDYMVAGLISAVTAKFIFGLFRKRPFFQWPQYEIEMKWHLLSFSLAIQEINQNPKLLPKNITLGYTVYENTFHPRVAYSPVLGLLPSAQDPIPNYKCGRWNHLLAVLETSESDIALDISTLLSTYKVPQVSHGFHLAALKDRTRFPFFYQMAPTEEAQYLGIVQLLLHFRWTWVGLFAQENDSGDKFRSTLTALMLKSRICVAFSETLSETGTYLSNRSRERIDRLALLLSQGQVNVFVFYGDVLSILLFDIFRQRLERDGKVLQGKIWITTLLLDSRWSLACSQGPVNLPRHGSLSIMSQTKTRMLSHHTQSCSPLLKEFMEQAFDSSYSKTVLSGRGHLRYREKERLEARPWEALKEYLPVRAYNIYTSVHAVARALQAAYSSRSERTTKVHEDRLECDQIKPWQVPIFP